MFPLRKRSKHKKHQIVLPREYYQKAFFILHNDLDALGYNMELPHPVREDYWHKFPVRQYTSDEATPILLEYLGVLDSAMQQIIEKKSLAYWLHLYRRIAPKPAGDNKSPASIDVVRATLESAIQKYAKLYPCGNVAISSEVPINIVLSGLLMSSSFQEEREIVSSASQLVLTNFSTSNLVELYDLEKLAFEYWRCTATLRAVGKGASIFISGLGSFYFERRTDELEFLIESFDNRYGQFFDKNVSSKGIIFEDDFGNDNFKGQILIPFYNCLGVSASSLNEFLEKAFSIRLPDEYEPNFVWTNLNIRRFLETHKPFESIFFDHYSIKLDAVILVITALFWRVLITWREGQFKFLHFWQRGYEGPFLKSYVVDEVFAFLPLACHNLNIDYQTVQRQEILAAMAFLELDNSKNGKINLQLADSHYMLLPFNEDRVFINYAFIHRRLYSLFDEINDLPDQNFKAYLLEDAVRKGDQALPNKPCKALNGTSKQIDAAFSVGGRLVIVECKAMNWSSGLSLGIRNSIEYRRNKIDDALHQIDDKANWLAKNPVGTNYDVRCYTDIIPVVVTPFVEYIPSTDSYYWFNSEFPRVLTIKELWQIMENQNISAITNNTISIPGG